MTPAEFSAGVDRILASGVRGHEAHRALDELWTVYARDLGGPVAEATERWMRAIEGGHDVRRPYPAAVPSQTYVHRFCARCPNNGLSIAYTLTLETHEVVMVEDIASACAVVEKYHEGLADKLAAQLPGRQVLEAHHHGVDIRTVRGFF